MSFLESLIGSLGGGSSIPPMPEREPGKKWSSVMYDAEGEPVLRLSWYDPMPSLHPYQDPHVWLYLYGERCEVRKVDSDKNKYWEAVKDVPPRYLRRVVRVEVNHPPADRTPGESPQ